jgi:ABC-type multidrug transport system fused ATPase/permease subunit
MEEEDREVLGSNREYLAAMLKTLDILRWVWREFIVEKSRKWLAFGLILSVGSRIVSLAHPWLMGFGIDGLIERSASMVVIAVCGTFAVQFITTLIDWRHGRYVELSLGENMRSVERRINELFFEKELGLHLQENNKLTQSNMEKGYNSFRGLQETLLFNGVDSFNTLIITWMLLILISPIAGLIILGVLVINAFISLSLNRFVMSACIPVEEQFRQINRRRTERWEFVERVKTCGQEGREVSELDTAFERAINDDRLVWFKYISYTTLRNVVNGVGVTTVFAYAAYMVWIGNMSMAELVPVLTWSGMASQQTRFLARIERQINWCSPYLKSLKEALTLPRQVVEKEDAVELDSEKTLRIEFDEIVHQYSSKNGSPPKNVLFSVSFTVEPGEKVALIGSSGAGKSTITRLVQRMMDPSGGIIRVGGHDLRDIRLKSFIDQYAYIPQKPQIINGTLRDNLLYALSPEDRALVGDEQLWHLMRDFRIDFGSRLTDGLDTKVGRRGVELSGGEAQRVMIGAAAIQKPRFMIIDEATSSLDADAQAVVQKGLHKLLSGDASALIIAHRLSTILNCDKFVVLRPVDSLLPGQGQVEAIAKSPLELYRVSPTFKRLADLEGVSFDSSDLREVGS